MFRPLTAAFAASLALASTAAAEIVVHDAYARSASPVAKSGAVFMVLENTGDTADRLVAAATDAAARVELHTHIENTEGVMRMVEVKDGFEVPAGGRHALKRGGDHVMLMGLAAPLEQGATLPLTLTFEQAGEVTLDVVVDSERQPAGHGGMHHGH